AEKSSLVVEPKAALVSPSDSFLPLGYLHVSTHPGGEPSTWGGHCRLNLVVVGQWGNVRSLVCQGSRPGNQRAGL
ncbi:MAG TPA: hypothetical protein PKL10_18340, partial [Nitrospira sp.]|nr:hypothetical protein [Nitrospira sp.]